MSEITNNLKDSVTKEPISDIEKLKLWLDFTKWLIGSVALVFITFLFNWGLQERAQGISEIKEYNQHVALITEVDNVAKRRLLAQFFSNVTASKPLRKGWKAYYDSVNKDYLEYINKLDTAQDKLKNATDPLSIRKRDSLRNEKKALEEATITAPILTTQEVSNAVYLHITSEALRSKAKETLALLNSVGYNCKGIELVEVGLKRNEIRYLTATDRNLATDIQRYLESINTVSDIKDITHLGKGRRGTIEIWLCK